MNRAARRLAAVVALVVAVSALEAQAAVAVAKVFGDHMVLQRDAPVPVWGTAGAGEAVTVRFGDQSAVATANDKGVWKATLQPMSASAESRTMTVSASNTVTFNDVVVGEVWFCSGQSNMVMTIARSLNPKETIASADHAMIRFASGQFGAWRRISPDNAGRISAVAYHFGRHLHAALGVPIGLMHSAVGGTRIEAWTSERGMARSAAGRAFLEQRRDEVENYDPAEAQKRYEATLARWQKIADRYKQQGKRPPRKPSPPTAPAKDRPLSGNLFHNKVRPSIPYALRGFVWYQGEANVARSETYRDYLTSMIADWRARWGGDGLPFLVVQLPNFREATDVPSNSSWARLREAQAGAAAAHPQTHVAVTIDVGDANDIHPKNKREVGRRLALIAQASVYGQAVAHSGPVMKSAEASGDRFVVTFEHADGLKAKDGEAVKGFAVAGEDRVFHWANAVIEDDRVVVRCDKVETPVALRYGWADNPRCNLTNASGLPAMPFRTDDWPPSERSRRAAVIKKKRASQKPRADKRKGESK